MRHREVSNELIWRYSMQDGLAKASRFDDDDDDVEDGVPSPFRRKEHSKGHHYHHPYHHQVSTLDEETKRFQRCLIGTLCLFELLIVVAFWNDPSTRMYSPVLNNAAYKQHWHDEILHSHRYRNDTRLYEMSSGKPCPPARKRSPTSRTATSTTSYTHSNNSINHHHDHLPNLTIVVLTTVRHVPYVDVVVTSLLLLSSSWRDNTNNNKNNHPPPDLTMIREAQTTQHYDYDYYYLRLLNTARPSSSHTDIQKFKSINESNENNIIIKDTNNAIFDVVDLYPEQQSQLIISSSNNNNNNSSSGNTTTTTRTPTKSVSHQAWLRRETKDYVTALGYCQRLATPWCIILEEDALPTHSFLAKFWALVNQDGGDDDDTNVAYIKLFTSDAWIGFGWNWPHLGEIALMGCLALAIHAMVGFYVSKCVRPTWQPKQEQHQRQLLLPLHLKSFSSLKKWQIIIVWIWFYVNARIVTRQALRGKWLQTFVVTHNHPHVLRPCTSRASTVAVAFPKESVPLAMSYLEHQQQQPPKRKGQKETPIDLALDDWARNNTYHRRIPLQAVPSLVQHLGAYSSKRTKPFFNGNVLHDSLFRIQ